MGRTVREVDESRPVFWLKPFEHPLDRIVRAGAAMFSVFGALALGLAIFGLTA